MNRFPDNARVCFIGDSMTAANQVLSRIIHHYNIHFPNHGITFFNCGTSGGTCGGALTFFEDDVRPHMPTHAVIAFGINDCGSWHLLKPRGPEKFNALESAFQRYQNNIRSYVQLLQAHNVHVTLCTPPIYDEYAESTVPARRGCYSVMAAYADFICRFAADNGLGLCDYHKLTEKAVVTDHQPVITEDRIHPTEHGYYLMAKQFLAAQGLQIDPEAPIPPYLQPWRNAIERLRVIYSAEEMVIGNYALPTEQKIAMLQEKLHNPGRNSNPAFEPFIRGFVNEMPNKAALYQLIDRLYETQVRNGHRTDK